MGGSALQYPRVFRGERRKMKGYLSLSNISTHHPHFEQNIHLKKKKSPI